MSALLETVLGDYLGQRGSVVLPWEIPQWDERHCDNDLAEILALAPQEFFPLLHALSVPHLRRVPWYDAPMTAIPFDTLVKAVFTRAFENAGLPEVRSSQATKAMLLRSLQQTGLHTLQGVSEALMALPGAVERTLLVSRDALRDLSRPGAWLLDVTYTMVKVLCGYRAPKSTRLGYRVVSNEALRWLMDACAVPATMEADQDESYRTNKMHRGNVAECLAWCALEADQPQLVLAMAWHCHQRELPEWRQRHQEHEQQLQQGQVAAPPVSPAAAADPWATLDLVRMPRPTTPPSTPPPEPHYTTAQRTLPVELWMLLHAAWPLASPTDVARAANAALAQIGQGVHYTPAYTPHEYEVLQRAYLSGAMSSSATPSASTLARRTRTPPPASQASATESQGWGARASSSTAPAPGAS